MKQTLAHILHCLVGRSVKFKYPSNMMHFMPSFKHQRPFIYGVSFLIFPYFEILFGFGTLVNTPQLKWAAAKDPVYLLEQSLQKSQHRTT